jgi:Cu/Ag efflux protein CusF
MTLAVADDAKITLNGNEAKLADLKAGDKVECETAKKDDATVAKTIAAKRE